MQNQENGFRLVIRGPKNLSGPHRILQRSGEAENSHSFPSERLYEGLPGGRGEGEVGVE